MHLRHSFVAALTVLGLSVACSGGDDGAKPHASPGPTGMAGGTSIIIGTGGTGGSNTPSPSGGSASNLGSCEDFSFNGCVGEGYEGESVPLDIYIMFDTSGSMLNEVGGGETRMQAIQEAAAAFLRDPASEGIGVGIGYFGYLPLGSTSCDSAEYATPDVEVTTDHEAVIASLDAREPTGETPTAAALRGACGYARAEQDAHPERALVVLLMTDGKPEAPISCGGGGCCPTLDDATAAANECASGPDGLPIYVLGVGPELDNLNQIAAAGKTRSAYLVSDDDVTANVLHALNTIRGDAVVPCTLHIPEPRDGSTLDYSQVNLVYSTSGCNFVPAYYVDSPASCDAEGGWYYDNPSAPANVELCPATCNNVSIPGAALRFSFGCGSLPKPVK